MNGLTNVFVERPSLQLPRDFLKFFFGGFGAKPEVMSPPRGVLLILTSNFDKLTSKIL